MATLAPDRSGSSRAGSVGSVTVEVFAATVAARDTVTFTLAVPGTRQAPAPYQPGQFVTLAIPYNGTTHYRSYSLCGAGRAEAPWEITVKRTIGGVVSNYLIDHVRPGMRLRASMPQGTFTLPAGLRPGAPLVFVAAGSGITPIYGMLRAINRLPASQRPRVQLHYAHHSPRDAIFGRQLASLDPEGAWLTQRWYVTTSGQRLTPEAVLSAARAHAASAEWYLCGPVSLTRAVREAALRWGVPEPRMHTEVFASPSARPRQNTPGVVGARIRLADSGAVLSAQAGETLIETLERSGYRPDFSCRSGACGTCKLKLLRGQVADGGGESGALTPRDEAQGYVLSCVAQPEGDVTLATAGPQVAAPAPAGFGGGSVRKAQPVWLKPLRTTLAAASIGVFIGMVGLTVHHSFASTSSSSSSSTSSAGTSSSSGSSNSSSANNSTGSSSSSGSSGIQIPSFGSSSGTNTSSGVS